VHFCLFIEKFTVAKHRFRCLDNWLGDRKGLWPVKKTRSSADADKPTFRGQSRSPNVVPFDMLGMVSYKCSIVTLSVEIFDFKNAVTLKTGLGVRQDHCKCHRSIERIGLSIDVLW